MNLNARLSNNKVNDGILTRRSDKKSNPNASSASQPSKSNNNNRHKRKAVSHAVTTQPQPTDSIKKAYTGNAPKCPKCPMHHSPNIACIKCTKCNRWGHLAENCRTKPENYQRQGNPNNPHNYPLGSCYNCGGRDHFKNECPKLKNTAKARNFQIGTRHDDSEDSNGKYLFS